MKRFGCGAGILGALLVIGVFGYVMRQMSTIREVAKVPLLLNDATTTDPLDVNTEQKCLLLLQVSPVTTEGEAGGPEEPYDVPVTYSVTDGNGAVLKADSLDVTSDDAARKPVPQPPDAAAAQVTYTHYLTVFDVPPPGKIMVEIEAKAGENEEGAPAAVSLMVYDNVAFGKGLNAAVIIFWAGLLLIPVGVIAFIIGALRGRSEV